MNHALDVLHSALMSIEQHQRVYRERLAADILRLEGQLVTYDKQRSDLMAAIAVLERE